MALTTKDYVILGIVLTVAVYLGIVFAHKAL